MAERKKEHRKSFLVLSARFPVVNWRSRPVAKSAYLVAEICFYHTKHDSTWRDPFHGQDD